jgi:hypothetical protein
MTIQLSADGDSPLPISWKSKTIEIAMPCVAPVSSLNSFLRTSPRIAGAGQTNPMRTDLDAILDSGPAGNQSSSADKPSTSTETKPATRRSARLRGETAQQVQPGGTSVPEAPAQGVLTAQPGSGDIVEDDDDRSTEHGDDIPENGYAADLVHEDMMLDDDDEDEDMDEDMEGEGIVSDL